MENMENMQNHKPLDPALLWAQIATDAGRTVLEMQATDEEYNWKLPDRAHPILCSGETPYMACTALSFSYQHPDWELEMWHGREQLWP